MHHHPNDRLIESVSAHVSIRDIAVNARFCNPARRPFDYGFQLRRNNEHPFLVFYVHSDGYWQVFKGRNPPYETIAEGRAPGLSTNANWCNFLGVRTAGNLALLVLNGERLTANDGQSVFDLGHDTHAGLVKITTGNTLGSEHQGGITRYEYFFGAVQLSSAASDGAGSLDVPEEWLGQRGGPPTESETEPHAPPVAVEPTTLTTPTPER